MSYEAYLRPRAENFLKKADKVLKDQIIAKLSELENLPKQKGERLKGSPFWKVRIGDYRAIYDIDEPAQKIYVLCIGHRKNVYDDMSKMLI